MKSDYDGQRDKINDDAELPKKVADNKKIRSTDLDLLLYEIKGASFRKNRDTATQPETSSTQADPEKDAEHDTAQDTVDALASLAQMVDREWKQRESSTPAAGLKEPESVTVLEGQMALQPPAEKPAAEPSPDTQADAIEAPLGEDPKESAAESSADESVQARKTYDLVEVENWQSRPEDEERYVGASKRQNFSIGYALFVTLVALMFLSTLWALLVSSGVLPANPLIPQIEESAAGAEQEKTGAILPDVRLRELNGITYVTIENYEIVLVNKEYSLPADYGDGIKPEAQSAFDAMVDAAYADGVSLWIVSGYRSYSYQQELHQRMIEEYGQDDAARVSAEAGHSEHQTGYAFDVAGADSAAVMEESFKDTETYAWLDANAAEYGFILRYPEGKEWATGYVFEPWHYRYVGRELALILKEKGLAIEEYLTLAQ